MMWDWMEIGLLGLVAVQSVAVVGLVALWLRPLKDEWDDWEWEEDDDGWYYSYRPRRWKGRGGEEDIEG